MAEINSEHNELIKHLKGIQHIVINTQYGGFSLSREAILMYLDLSGTEYTLEPQKDRDTQTRLGSKIMVNGEVFWDREIPRNDPALISTVRRLGSKAGGEYATLKVVEVPAGVDWYVDEYDGKEWVAEKHRTWR